MVRRNEGLELGAQSVGTAVRVLVARRDELPEVAAMNVVASQRMHVIGCDLLHEAGAVEFTAQRHFFGAPLQADAYPRTCRANRKTGTLQ